MLQLCVKPRLLRPWFSKMAKQETHFTAEDGNPLEAHSRALHEPFDMERGPLWRVKLVTGKEVMTGAGGGDSGGGGVCSVVLICIHHCLTDGVTNMVLCQDFIEILNSLLTQVPTPRPFIRPVTPALADQLLTTSDYIKTIPYLTTKLIGRLMLTYNKTLYLDGVLPQPTTTHARTHVLQFHLTPTQTAKLIQRCKEKKVTVHSCVVAAANLALLKVGQNRNGKLKKAALNTTNCVNLRRYFAEGEKDALGCHFALEEHEQMVTEEDWGSEDSFWGFVKVLHSRLLRSLGPEKRPVKNGPLFRPCCLVLWANHSLTRKGRKNR